MGKLLNSLNKQLKSEHKLDAEDCLKIYNHLKETNDGRVWASQWNNLVTTNFEGTYPNSVRISKPNQIGRIFLKYINEREKQTAYLEFINGTQWQAERMYSEEDMVEFAEWIADSKLHGFSKQLYEAMIRHKVKTTKELLKIWFEQFKKK